MKHLILCVFLCCSIESSAQKPIENKVEMCSMLREMIEGDRLYRRGDILDSFAGKQRNYAQKEIDSVWALQWKIDNANTEKLIELTKKHGWISDKRIDCPQLDVWLIFRHSQKKYFDEISELIEKEHASGRLNDFHFKLIDDQLKGRPRG